MRLIEFYVRNKNLERKDIVALYSLIIVSKVVYNIDRVNVIDTWDTLIFKSSALTVSFVSSLRTSVFLAAIPGTMCSL